MMNEQELTKRDMLIFLTEWEYEFLWDIESLKEGGQELSEKQQEKFQEIDAKLQDLLDDIKSKSGTSSSDDNSSIKPRSINFEYFSELRHDDKRLTLLTERQRDALKKIKKYILERARNTKNWNSRRDWSPREESVGTRVDVKLYEDLERYKKVNKRSSQSIIQNYVRTFLRNRNFRRDAVESMREQLENELHQPIEAQDLTEFYQQLITLYPNPVSGNITMREKNLFTFYCVHVMNFNISYAIRNAIIYHRDLPHQDKISEIEVVPIYFDLYLDRLEEDIEMNLEHYKYKETKFDFENPEQEFMKVCGFQQFFYRFKELAIAHACNFYQMNGTCAKTMKISRNGSMRKCDSIFCQKKKDYLKERQLKNEVKQYTE